MFLFEDLEVYKKAKSFVLNIYKIIDGQKKNELYFQLERAALSITLNIAEGTGRHSNKDRCNFYYIARGSVFETAALLDIYKERSLIDQETFDRLYKGLEEIGKMLSGLIKSTGN